MCSGGGDALDAVGGQGVAQVRVLGDVPGGQAHRVVAFAAAVCLDRPGGSVVGDVLHDPLLTVRRPEGGVVLASLDQITPPDGQPVTAGRRHLIVYDSGVDALVADAGVQACGFVVGGDRDRLATAVVLCDVVVQALGVGVQADQSEGVELGEPAR